MTSNYNKAYYQKNKEKILSHILEKVDCPVCSCKVARCNLSKHKNSNKHKMNITKQKEETVDDLVKKALKRYLRKELKN